MRFSTDENKLSDSIRTGIDGHPETNIDDLINYIDLTQTIGNNLVLIVKRPNKGI
jgi:hypothetical protein